MKALICDKCGQIFPADGLIHGICIDGYLTIFEPKGNAPYHLCDTCLDALKAWLDKEMYDCTIKYLLVIIDASCPEQVRRLAAEKVLGMFNYFIEEGLKVVDE